MLLNSPQLPISIKSITEYFDLYALKSADRLKPTAVFHSNQNRNTPWRQDNGLDKSSLYSRPTSNAKYQH